MNIIVPLAGSSDDFIKKYNTLKPLTIVGEETVIDKFISSFKFDFEYIFICRLEDMLNSNLLEKLNNIKIKKKILIIDFSTNNVIDTILGADKYMNGSESVTIVHPDSIINFNKYNFLNLIKNKKIDGLVFTYDLF